MTPRYEKKRAKVLGRSMAYVEAGEGDPIVLDGVKDLVVVHANGRILVMSRERAGDLKRVLNQLPPEVRDLGPSSE